MCVCVCVCVCVSVSGGGRGGGVRARTFNRIDTVLLSFIITGYLCTKSAR